MIWPPTPTRVLATESQVPTFASVKDEAEAALNAAVVAAVSAAIAAAPAASAAAPAADTAATSPAVSAADAAAIAAVSEIPKSAMLLTSYSVWVTT
jgi:hypothetical protein